MNSNIVIAQSSPRPDSFLIEIPVASNGLSSVSFPTNMQELMSDASTAIIIKAMRLILVTVLTNAVTLTGANAPIAELKKMALQLVVKSRNKGFNIPILTLNDVNDLANPFVSQLANFDDWQDIDWNKSKIVFAQGTSSANSPYNVLIDTQYIRVARNTGERMPD